MDAYYQTYKNKKATEFVLKNFFLNSNGKVYLVSDCGDDFSYLLNIYPNRIIYAYENKNIKTVCWNKNQCLEWLIRVQKLCQNLTSNYVMILEDDVFIRGNLDNLKMYGEIMGVPNITKCFIYKELEQFINLHGKINGSYQFYCACGGSVFNRKIYLENYKFCQNIIDIYFDEMIIKSKNCIRFSDCCLSVYFNLAGYKCNENPEHTETWQADWKINNKKIVHQYKFLYQLPTP